MPSKTRRAVLLVAGVLIVGGGLLATGEQPEEPKSSTTVKDVVRPKFASEAGWAWLMTPTELRIGEKWGQAGSDGMILTGFPIIDADGGALRIAFAQTGPSALEIPAFRLVVFDKAGKRHLPKSSQSGGLATKGTHLETALFTLDPKELAPGEAAYIGVEHRTK